VQYKNQEYPVETSLVGLHGVHLLLPVVGLLADLGYKPGEITRLLKAVRLPADFLHASQTHGKHVVNNTFGTDPQYLTGFSEYLKQFHAKKILVLDADILAGTLTGSEQLKIGRTLSREFGYIFLVTSPAARLLRQGIRAGNKRCHVTSGDEKLLSRFLASLVEKDDLVLFYGPRTEPVLRTFSARRPHRKRSGL
jgi:UDP-N-acetylmuramyl pentapeptide synthase